MTTRKGVVPKGGFVIIIIIWLCQVPSYEHDSGLRPDLVFVSRAAHTTIAFQVVIFLEFIYESFFFLKENVHFFQG